jgi:hypothetical protein
VGSNSSMHPGSEDSICFDNPSSNPNTYRQMESSTSSEITVTTM